MREWKFVLAASLLLSCAALIPAQATGKKVSGTIDTFRQAHGLRDDAVRGDEMARALGLVREKFGTAAWTGIVA